MNRRRAWTAALAAMLLAVACAGPPAPRPRDPADDQVIWPAGPPPTTPGERGDVPQVPPVVKP
jgi:hypothetical protein